MPGPKPTPPEILKLRGSRIRTDQGMRRADDLLKTDAPYTRPLWLSEQEAEVWDYYAGLLQPMGLLTATDVDAFAFLCVLTVQVREAARLARMSPLVNGPSGPKQNPAGKHLCMLVMQWRQLSAMFGLSPADRLTKADGGGDSLDKLLAMEVG